ncbi:MAG: hypothetical protein VR64_06950 [Desulfatitalea sp. BRH_c12]|nr:MAG: hypothetical protein VR64_06950 [Desulfatitalea sp. BRH_c12]
MGRSLPKIIQCLLLSVSLLISPAIAYFQLSDVAYADKPAWVIEKKINIEKKPVKSPKKNPKKAPEPAVWLLAASGLAILSFVHFKNKKKQ